MTPAAVAVPVCAILATLVLVQGIVVEVESSVPAETPRVTGILDAYDPLRIPEQDFDVNLTEITAKGSVKDLILRGLSGLAVNSWSLHAAEGTATANLTLPSISVEGNYSVSGTLSAAGITLPLDGAGPLTFDLTGFKLEAAIELGISDKGQILLDSCDLTWNITGIELRLDGLFGGKALGKLINDLLADTLPYMVQQVYHDKITSLVQTQAAAFLESIHEDHGTPPSASDLEDSSSLFGPRNSGDSQDSDLEDSNDKRFEEVSLFSVQARTLDSDEDSYEDSDEDSDEDSEESEDSEDSETVDMERQASPSRNLEDSNDKRLNLEKVLSLFSVQGHSLESEDSEDSELSNARLNLEQLDLSQLLRFEVDGQLQFFPHGELSNSVKKTVR